MKVQPLTSLTKQQKIGLSAFILVAAIAAFSLIHSAGSSTTAVEVQPVDEATQPAQTNLYSPAHVQVVDFKLPRSSEPADKPAASKPSAPVVQGTTVTKQPTAATATEPTVVQPIEQPGDSALIQESNGDCTYAANEPKITQELVAFFKEKKCKVVHFFQNHSAKQAPVTTTYPSTVAPTAATSI